MGEKIDKAVKEIENTGGAGAIPIQAEIRKARLYAACQEEALEQNQAQFEHLLEIQNQRHKELLEEQRRQHQSMVDSQKCLVVATWVIALATAATAIVTAIVK